MIRTVWLAIACLIGIAALTVIKVGTTSFEAAFPSDQSTSLNSDASSSDPAFSDTLPKADRLDVADEGDAVKPVRPIAIAITTKVAQAAASEASSSEKSWRSSYAKRQAGVAKHRKGKLHKASRRHRSYHASRSHRASKYMTVRASKHMTLRKQKKSRSRA